MNRYLANIVLGSLLCGCATTSLDVAKGKYKNYVNNVPDLNSSDVNAFVMNYDAVMIDFAKLAGVSPPNANGEWRPIVDAGINYVDTRCDRFMDSLFWFNRARETTSRQLQYTGSAVGAALAVVEASKTAIGLTPLGFSLFDQTINNFGAGLLYNLNPSTVRILVEKRQDAYVQSLTPSYTSKAIALRVIQGYASLCLPPAIESEVERAIGAKEYTSNTIYSALPPPPGDTDPNPFLFTEAAGAKPGAEVTSNAIVVTGIGSPAPITVTGGLYRIVGSKGSWTSDAGTVSSGQHVQVKVVAADAADLTRTATLTIGNVSSTFSVRTAPAVAPLEPSEDAGQSQGQEGAPPPPPPPPFDDTKLLESSSEQNGIPNPQ